MTDYFCRKWNWHRRWSYVSLVYRTWDDEASTITETESERRCAICGVTIIKKSERRDTITTSYPKEDEIQ